MFYVEDTERIAAYKADMRELHLWRKMFAYYGDTPKEAHAALSRFLSRIGPEKDLAALNNLIEAINDNASTHDFEG